MCTKFVTQKNYGHESQQNNQKNRAQGAGSLCVNTLTKSRSQIEKSPPKTHKLNFDNTRLIFKEPLAFSNIIQEPEGRSIGLHLETLEVFPDS